MPNLTRILLGSGFYPANAPASAASAHARMAGGLRLIRHDEPEFDYHVSETYPKMPDHPLYSRARKFMAVLHHEGDKHAKAYRVLWTIQQPGGNQRTLQKAYALKHCTTRDNVKTIAPGKKRLISPFFNYSTADYNFRADRVFAPGSMEEGILSRFPYLDAELVSVSVDAAIYDGGTIAGTDQFDLRNQYLAIRAAEHDEGVSVWRKLEKMKAALGQGKNIDRSQVATFLDAHIQYRYPAQDNSANALYAHARGVEASLLKGLLQTRGIDEFEADVRRRLRYLRDNLIPVA